ncbi:MAG: 16S rRNA processing protein RimM [Bacteroidaceae bacterium]|nr:16S rRNA processing protein RimM [Bacteroidaceae bacterium]
MIQYSDVYKIGTITKAHGLQGKVVLNFSDDIFDTTDADYLIIDVDGILVPFFISEYRFRSNASALMKFDHIESAEQTQQIVGCDVYFEKSKAQEAGTDEMSLNYFIGFTMLDEQGAKIGEITDIDDKTDNWLFVVERDNGDEALVPAQESFIVDINHEKRTMTMDLPVGLLDL